MVNAWSAGKCSANCYLAQSYGHVIDTDLDGFFENLVVVLSVPGELAFAGYLLFRGVRAPASAVQER